MESRSRRPSRTPHESGFVHRDLKPSNVMVTENGAVKVLDFGLAQPLPTRVLKEITASASTLAEPRGISGTLPYMAPEVLQGQPADGRTDICALGIILYEAATGSPPFTGRTTFELSTSILRDSPPVLSSSFPASFRAVLDRSLEKAPIKRYARAGEVELALQAISRAAARSSSRLPPPPGHETDSLCSIAVLPLANLSGDPSQEFFADGMTEALISELAKISGLRVISRTSAMYYKGKSKPLREIAGELKVATLVEGSVLRVGGRVRITAQLIDGVSDSHLWAESYERDLKNILSLQSDVARAIAAQVTVSLSPEPQARPARTRSFDPGAHEAYLRGRHHLHKVGEAEARRAIRLFQQAIDFDPASAPAFAGLADGYVQLGSWLKALPVNEAMPRAKAAAKKALELDPSLAEAHSALAYVSMFYDWDWDTVERELQQAIELNPSYSVAHLYYSWYLDSQRRLEESLAELELAQRLDPLSIWIEANAAFFLCWAGRYQEAIEGLSSTLRFAPDFALAHWMLGATYAAQGMYHEAIDEFRETLAQGKQYLGWLGYALAKAGRREEAQSTLDEMQDLLKKQSVSADDMARVHIGLGNIDEAFRWLDRALDERAVYVVYLRVDPSYAPLRSDPRYNSLLARIMQEP